MDFLQADKLENCDWGTEKKTVICKACAAESIYDALQTSAVCPFCGSNQVMEASTEKTIAPGGVVPFKLTDKDASTSFHDWIRHKWFCPKQAKESVKPKAFAGIYLPYWTFDTDTFSVYTAQYGIDHTTRDSEGNSHTTTNWHNTSGQYHEFFNDELILASKNHDTNMIKALEPFDTENNTAYKPEYVAGFVSERYSVGLKDGWGLARQSIYAKLNQNISGEIRMEQRADHVRNLQVNPNYTDVTYKYLLLPIWLSNYKYKDKVYQFMVNGQTGKVAGKTPISALKVAITVVLGLAILAGIYYLKTHFGQ